MMPTFIAKIEWCVSFAYLSESSCAATHDFTLADELGVEFGPVERQVDIKVYTVESSLRGIHAFEILFEVLS